jgi:hypothetical protein
MSDTRHQIIAILLLVLPFGTLGLLAAATCEAAEAVPIGVAHVDITPETPVRMYGYASRKTESEGVAGRLHAKALAIGGDEGDGPAVLLTVDCGSVPVDLRNRIYARVNDQTPVAPERFVLSNSHNHSGPNLKGMAAIDGDEHDRLVQYAKLLEDRLVDVVTRALDGRAPGYLSFARGQVGFAANRRVLTDGKWSGFGAIPGAPVDHSLPVLKVTARDGSPVAIVANYACHNTTLRGNFKQIHGDWAGCAQQYIEADTPGVVALITIGCGADSDPCPHSTVALCEQHGRALADECRELLQGDWRSISPQVVARERIVDVPYAEMPEREELEQAAQRTRTLGWLIRQQAAGAEMPRSKPYRIVTWTFGDDLAMVFLSDEVTVDYALRLQRELDAERLWITAYAHDVSTYIVSPRLIAEGGYEPNNSLSSLVTFGHPERLEPSMEHRIIQAVKEILPTSFRAAP